MINVEKIANDKERCLGHTGLTPEMIQTLLPVFEVEYEIYADKRHKERHGKERLRKSGAGNKGKLDTSLKKMFFILYYIKSYPTYEVQGGVFDMARPRAYEWVQATLEPLLEALKKTVVSQRGQQKSWKEFWKNIQKGKISL